MLKGVFSALLISFNEDGSINEKGIREIVNYNIDFCGVDGLYVGGSTGENFMLSTEEKKKIFTIVKDEAKDRVKLIAQIGSINIIEAKELAKFATDLGYDALSAVTPFYYKFNFEEIRDYYNGILEDVNNKMIIYSIPFLTGVNLTVEEFEKLFENEKIIGVKFTAGDFYLLERVRRHFPDKLIFSGFDEMLLPAIVLGVDGAIGSTFNINGKKAIEIFDAVKAERLKDALRLQHETNDFISDVLENGLYSTLKIILKEKGVDAGYCRKPMKKYNNRQLIRGKEILQKYSL